MKLLTDTMRQKMCIRDREKINMKVDTTAIEQEISNYEKQLRQAYSTKSKLIEEMCIRDSAIVAGAIFLPLDCLVS